jgi:DnaJ-class molecular chaperone
MYVENKEEIIICRSCQGNGHKEAIEHRGPMTKAHTETCNQCNGTGRELKKTTIKIVPLVAK